MNANRTAAIATGSISPRVAGRSSSQSMTAWGALDRPNLEARGPRKVFGLRSVLDRGVKMRNLPEEFKPRVNLLTRHRLQALGAEALHRERPHHAAVEHRPAKDCRSQFRLRSQVTVESAGK